MDTLRQLLLAIHLTAGLAALVLFWVPALSRKGGPLHRRAGRWYVKAMTVVVVTGLPLAGLFIASERWRTGVFLLFLALITGTALWNGWRVLKLKTAPLRYTDRRHLAVALANVVGGAALIAFGIAVKAPLFYSFGPVGLLIGGGMLSLALRRTADPKYWLYEHFTGMIGSGIASHVAFLVFGGRQLFGWGQDGAGLVLWMAPVVIGAVAITALNIHHRAKSAAAMAAAPRPAVS